MATHDPDDMGTGPVAAPAPDRIVVIPNPSPVDSPADPAMANPEAGPILASQIPPALADTPGAVDTPLVPTTGTPAPGDPGGAAAGGEGPDSPNPVIGTPHLPHIEVPQGVIHSINAVPGESNPTLHGTSAEAAGAPTTTAELLAEREDAEEAWQRSGAGVDTAQAEAAGLVSPYEDAEENVHPASMEEGGRPNFSGTSEVTPLEYMESPHSYDSLIGQAGVLDAVDARMDAKAEANANAIERAESATGLTYHDPGNYENREFGRAEPERDDIMSGAGTGMGTQDPGPAITISAIFPSLDHAQLAVQQLREIGIAPDAIALVARQGDAGTEPAGVAEVTPAGEDTVRRSADELPNDEDLPATVADQTDTPTDEIAGTPRAGLSRDEGTIPRIEASADPEIYSDFVDSDADYHTGADEGAAQTSAPAPDTAAMAVDTTDVPVTHVTARSGALAGGLTGLLTGLAALAIPGIGPIVAAGPIAGALIGLVAGTIGGGLLGALLDAGVPEEHARTYAGRVAEGGVLLTVRADRVTRPSVRNILAANGAEDLQG